MRIYEWQFPVASDNTTDLNLKNNALSFRRICIFVVQKGTGVGVGFY